MYKDIYKGLKDEEREKMIREDIPKFEPIGKVELTEDEKKQADEALFRLIEESKKNRE